MHTLYKLTFKSGKSYVGQTIRKLKVRIAAHRNAARIGSKLAVHCAWRSHGEPEIEILGEFQSHAELHAAEIEAIVTHKTLSPNGYNIGHGGETAPSKNPDVAKRISERLKGKKHTDTAQFHKALKKRWSDPEGREKMLEGMRTCWTVSMKMAASERAKIRWEQRKQEGWTMPESQKEKLRNKNISDETRSRMSESAKRRGPNPVSDESRIKMSENAKRSWNDAKIRDKRLKSLKASFESEERSEKLKRKASDSWKDPDVRARRIAAIRASKQKKNTTESQEI
ncbi:hypothetical protein D3C76_752080 [compost metagenome]